MTEPVVHFGGAAKRGIRPEDIEEGKRLLGYKDGKTFPGCTVLDNPYAAEICERLNNGDSCVAISQWLREVERATGETCYVSNVTLSEFKKSWYDLIKNKAVEGLIREEYQSVCVAGIEFQRAVLEREGAFKKSVMKEQKVIIDGRKELFDMLEYVKEQLDTDERNKIHWSKQWLRVVETHLKLLGETAQSPQLHLELMQHEISIYIEANIQAIREMFGSDKEEEYLKLFEAKYKKLAVVKGSVFVETEPDSDD